MFLNHTDELSWPKKTTLKPQYVIAFFFCLILCRLFPYTGDDWTWGGPIGIERLSVCFKDYGGRYFGYLIVLALTRSVWLRAITMSAFYIGTCILIERIVRHSWAFYISVFFLLFLPKLILRQAVIWTSGFSNYGTATFFSLVFALYAISRLNTEETKKPRIVRDWAFLFLLGLTNSLILENMALYMLCMSVAVTVYYHQWKKTWDRPFLSHVAGTVFGTILMFSNSAYRNLFEEGDVYAYRQFSTQNLSKRIYENWCMIYQEGFLNNLALNIAFFFVCFLCVAGIIHHKKKISWKLVSLLSIYGAFVAYSIVSIVYITEERSARLYAAEGLFALVALISLFLLLVIGAIVADSSFGSARDTVFFVLSFFMILAPLFPVYPIGSRCFYPSYIYLVVLLCSLIKHTEIIIMRDENGLLLSDQIKSLAKNVLIVGSTVLFLVYFALFLSIHKTDVDRLATIRERAQAGETEIRIQHFHHESFLWNATPTQGSKWEYRYKLFYGLPDEITLIPYSDTTGN